MNSFQLKSGISGGNKKRWARNAHYTTPILKSAIGSRYLWNIMFPQNGLRNGFPLSIVWIKLVYPFGPSYLFACN